jgi:hypothetical protein
MLKYINNKTKEVLYSVDKLTGDKATEHTYIGITRDVPKKKMNIKNSKSFTKKIIKKTDE